FWMLAAESVPVRKVSRPKASGRSSCSSVRTSPVGRSSAISMRIPLAPTSMTDMTGGAAGCPPGEGAAGCRPGEDCTPDAPGEDCAPGAGIPPDAGTPAPDRPPAPPPLSPGRAPSRITSATLVQHGLQPELLLKKIPLVPHRPRVERDVAAASHP